MASITLHKVQASRFTVVALNRGRRSARRGWTFHELVAQHGDVLWSNDADLSSAVTEPNEGHLDVISNGKFFTAATRNQQH